MVRRSLKTLVLSVLFLAPSLAVAQDFHHRGCRPRCERRHRPPRVQVMPMAPDAFEAFIWELQQTPFPSDRHALITQVAAHHHFLAMQVRRVITTVTFSSERMDAISLLAPRILDRENGFLLNGAFIFPSERRHAMALLSH